MIERLSQRDRIALAIGVAVVGLALIYFAVVRPYREALRGLEGRIATGQSQLAEVRDLQSRYQQLQRQLGAAEQRLARGAQSSLVSVVGDLAGRYVAKENVVGMRPQPATAQGDLRQEAVEVHLEKVRLGQVIQLLYAIDNAQTYLKVQTLHVTPRFDDKSLVDAVFTVATYRRGA